MPINRLLANMSLSQEEVGRLNDAYERALHSLHLVDQI